MTKIPLRLGLLLAALAAAAALVAAFAAEWWGGMVPCALCLVERWPYRIAAGLAVVGAVLPRAVARAAGWLVVLALLAGAAAAIVHVGVEEKAWPSPLPECAAPHFSGGSIAERLASMPAQPSKSCEDATYPVPGLPISFATLNLLYALALSATLATWLMRTRRSLA